ncbi:LamB/YcsF family protein [Pseudomonas sp. JG-B]|uniref:LamB/YcsF family protein n=1 Tax=Pseudomonas sp. JG-B TaxID=2603214 RepID=UPI00129ED09D|nr:5-oxoprolinase subunit PxpA [Pseudomonas sp. JG-B]MRK21928.1 LamB/YcsF family protein [Pseudomonas sp. JG-B]
MSNQNLSVDLNSDMGEGFGAYRMGDDEAILDIVSTANVACGFHAGDPEIMASTFALAKQKGVAVGAHPAFPDLWGFGRRRIPFSAGEIERLVAYQIGAAQALSVYAGHPITHVKAHGALGNLTQTDADVAGAVCRAIKAVDPSLACLVIALGHQARIAAEMGLEVRSEIFADRAYDDNGHLVHRSLPGAVIHDAQEASDRVVRMVKNQAIETITGRTLACSIDSICVHSDTPAAVAIAREVRNALERNGIAVASKTHPLHNG